MDVTSRMGRVSRNENRIIVIANNKVTSRMGRVSRTENRIIVIANNKSRPAWGV